MPGNTGRTASAEGAAGIRQSGSEPAAKARTTGEPTFPRQRGTWSGDGLGRRSPNSAESVRKAGGKRRCQRPRSTLLGRWRREVCVSSGRGLFHLHEPLDAAAGDRFGDIDVALRITGERVTD